MRANMSEMRKFLEHLQGVNKAFGRRGRDLTLPPHWPSQGVDTILGLSGTFFVKGWFSDASAPLPASLVGEARTIADFSIDLNFSQARATIVGPGVAKFMQVVKITEGSAAGIGQPAIHNQAPKRRLALEDQHKALALPPPQDQTCTKLEFDQADLVEGGASGSGSSEVEGEKVDPLANSLARKKCKAAATDSTASRGDFVPPPPPS